MADDSFPNAPTLFLGIMSTGLIGIGIGLCNYLHVIDGGNGPSSYNEKPAIVYNQTQTTSQPSSQPTSRPSNSGLDLNNLEANK